MRADLIAQAAFTLATGVLYLWVARFVVRRELSPEARPANRLFATWWLSLGLLYALSAAHTAAAGFGFTSLAITIVWLDVLLLIICAALWGLLGYLLYLYTGSRRLFVPLAFAYGAFAAALIALFAWRDPIGYKEGGIGVQIEYARQLSNGPQLILGLAVSLPILVAAVAYGSLYFRVKAKAPRYRIGMVAGAFLFQFGWSVLSTLLDLNDKYPDSFGLYVWRQAVAIIVPIVIVIAYRPPAWIRARIAETPTGA